MLKGFLFIVAWGSAVLGIISTVGIFWDNWFVPKTVVLIVMYLVASKGLSCLLWIEENVDENP